jgi:hypothetical protein
MNTNRFFVRLNSVVAILALMFYLSGIAMAQSPQGQKPADKTPPPEGDTFGDDGTPTFEDVPTPTFQPRPLVPAKQDDKEKGQKEKKEKKDKGDGVVQIQSALPDLKFGSVVVTPDGDVAGGSGVTGQAATITVTIINGGSGTAGEFRLDVWKHLPSPPNFGSIGDFSQTFSGLAGNTSLTVSYSFTMANSYGTYFPRSTVDSGSLVVETSEANNTNTGSYTVIEMATVVPPTINTVSGATVVFRGVAKPYGKKWPVGQPTALITVPGVGTVSVPNTGTAELAGVGVFGPIVKNLIGDASLTCALAQNFIGTATVTFICGTSTASGELRSVCLGEVTPASTIIGTGSSLTFTVQTNPANLAWPAGAPTATISPAGAGTLSPVGTTTGSATVTFHSHGTFDGVLTIIFGYTGCTSSTTLTVTNIGIVKWVGVVESDGTSNFQAGGNPPAQGGGDRIFAERNTPTGPIHNRIAIEITLSQPVPANSTFTVWFRVVDVDDPSQDFIAGGNPADSNDVDPGANPDPHRGNDNRFHTGATGGGMTPVLGSLTFTAGQTVLLSPPREITARQPGNNWKVVAGFSQQQVATDTVLNAGTANGQNNVLSFLRNGAPLAANYQSALLSVWRTLHVEVDSMGTVAGNNLTGNVIALAPGATLATVDVNIRTLDGSADLDSAPPQNGRFENGVLHCGPRASDLLGNGTNSFAPAAGGVIEIPFIMVDANQLNFVSGTLTLMTQSATFTNLALSVGTLTPGAYVGGTVRLGSATDPAYDIVANGMSSVITGTNAKAPYRANDDDDDTLLPHDPDLSLLESILLEAYVVVVNDGGGNIANNNSTVTFVPNVNSTAEMTAIQTAEFQSANNRNNEFWITWLLCAYQPNTNPAAPIATNVAGRADVDPDTESSLIGLGTADGNLANPVQPGVENSGAFIFIETLREAVGAYGAASFADLLRATIAHELLHPLGLPDRDSRTGLNPPFTGIMSELFSNPTQWFINKHDINIIRSRGKSPGKF